MDMSFVPFNALTSSHNDRGRKVIINSVGGALRNAPGTVLWGPNKLEYTAPVREKRKGRMGDKGRLVQKTFVTEPYWGIRLHGYNLELKFQKKEITFL